MTRETYSLLENYMLSCMDDSAHDREHVYRVLYHALEIAKTLENVDYDVLIAACLLHDIGRKEQFENPTLCHAAVGSEKAFAFLMAHGFAPEYAERIPPPLLKRDGRPPWISIKTSTGKRHRPIRRDRMHSPDF